MTYTNYPVYIGRANSSLNPRSLDSVNYLLFANTVRLSSSTSQVEKRTLGEGFDQDNQFAYTSDRDFRISLEFYLKPKLRKGISGDSAYFFLYDDDFVFANFQGNNLGNNYFPIKIGVEVYNRSYLNSYRIELLPNLPVKVSAEFTCKGSSSNFGPRQQGALPYEIYDKNLDGKDFIHADTCEVIGDYSQLITNDIFSKISYQKTYNRLFSYKPNQKLQTKASITSIQDSLLIEGYDLSKVCPIEGIKLENDLSINLKNKDGLQIGDGSSVFNIKMKAGSKVNQNSYNVQAGDVLNSSLVIESLVY